MSMLYTEACISFSLSFPNASAEHLVEPNDLLDFRSHEGAAGMNIGEMLETMDQPINLLHLTSELVIEAFAFSDLAFRPAPNAIALLQELYEHNVKRPISERRRFDEVPELQQNCEYTLQILPELQRDIFLKHPVTGAVTIHQHPYGDMPRFRLLTAHPSLVSVASARQITQLPSGIWRYDPLAILARLRQNIVWPPRQQATSATKKIIHCPTTPPSRKRKVHHQALDSSLPLKRARKTSIATNHPYAAKASSSSPISSPELRTNRKRKTDSWSDAPVTPPARRVRTRLARATQPPPVAGKATAQLARTCRPVRGAKTQAVARMAGVV
ncbi:hypothetical protein CYLTODRAFT_424259 [Cylindrobasidium torrendii FP15055 ss-10]|uniref:Uncharacterized protein n=1 Tax=Cylindrobasidium torrendii FP15055 ss-10 TaxID=1314674 RepID=A0A0D7B7M0_9AGAR|nr:hypothetical protein CYLTODRAFT_424259 [Cylindrobasidium torrendii FP15055 ss-10]